MRLKQKPNMNQKTALLTFEEHRILEHLSIACDAPPDDFLQSVLGLLGTDNTFREAVVETFHHHFRPEQCLQRESSLSQVIENDSDPSFREVLCKRCSSRIMTLKKRLRCSEATQRQFAGICKDCMTPVEETELKSATLADFIASNGGIQ
jgi:hypothetical protein